MVLPGRPGRGQVAGQRQSRADWVHAASGGTMLGHQDTVTMLPQMTSTIVTSLVIIRVVP